MSIYRHYQVNEMWGFEKFRDKTAVITSDRSEITYGSLHTAVKCIGKEIRSRGLVLILCTNTIGSLYAYLTAVEFKAVPVMISAGSSSYVIQDYIDKYCPEYIFAPKKSGDIYGRNYRRKSDAADYEIWEAVSHREKVLNDELALLLPTSGSTGSCKLVRISYRNIISNIESIISYLSIGSENRAITMLPMHYTYGLSVINTHIYAGATLILTDEKIYSRKFWQLFNECRCDSIYGVPYTYELMDKLGLLKRTFPSLKYMTQAGGKITKELHLKLADYCSSNGIDMYFMYGQTEAAARMAYLPPHKAMEKPCSVGIAVPGGKIDIYTNDGEKASEAFTRGEIVYSGKNVAMGYAECIEDLAKTYDWGNILHTGDTGYLDEDGYLYVEGRLDRYVKVMGCRLSLDELEQHLNKNIDGTCVCTSYGFDRIDIYTDSNSEELRLSAAEFTGINIRQFNINRVKQIPHTASGKIDYGRLGEKKDEE